MSDVNISAEEKKRRRLEAWRRKQQQQQQQQQQQAALPPAPPPSLSLPQPPPPPPPPKPKITLALGKVPPRKRRAPENSKSLDGPKFSVSNPFGSDSEEEEEGEDGARAWKRRRGNPPLDFLIGEGEGTVAAPSEPPLPQDQKGPELPESTSSTKKKKRKRWDAKAPGAEADDRSAMKSAGGQQIPNPPPGQPPVGGAGEVDALDQFMDQLQSSELPNIVTAELSIQAAGTMSSQAAFLASLLGGAASASVAPSPTSAGGRPPKAVVASGGVITADQLLLLDSHPARYTPSDWMSDAAPASEEENDEDDEREQAQRRAMIEALKAAPVPGLEQEPSANEPADGEDLPHRPAQLASEVKSEKSRREEQMRELERQAEEARALAEKAAAPELGRLFNDAESGVMEEAERDLAAAQAAPDALQVLAELNKKKELAAVDHSKVEYLPFTKNLYRVPRALASLSNDEVVDRRAKLKVRVRGHGAPAPVSSFEECGLSEKILKVLATQNIHSPFPVQAQCIPCIMAGRDVIGIAKTGSGKTLAYLLPLLRHIMAQPPLQPNESGPIGLILAPARELAYQIHTVCKSFTKQLGLKSTAVYGGAGVADQIGDLKRGTHIVVGTPGRLIDILTMQSGKVLSLRRVTYLVMDEADRMYDMGFAPQITAIQSAVRPDRQSVLFSATFPKAVEALARKSLQYPVEVIVGGRSVASDNVTQYAELVEENEKFLRLLQLLGENVEGTSKVIVFVDTQIHADALFEQLLRSGYSTLSLHGGMDQEDRDSTLSDFKRKDGPSVLVATGVAGRGLDVPTCVCVINYSSPNHLEAYVHQVGRTGRASNRGKAYTFVNSTDEAKYAPIVVRALSEAGQSENIQQELKDLAEEFKKKVEKGEARYAGSGFKGKGYSYDSTELSDAQKVARLEKRQALIEAGMLDPDDEDPLLLDSPQKQAKAKTGDDEKEASSKAAATASAPLESLIEIPENLTPELLALPGMKEALLRKAGIVLPPADDSAAASAITPEEVAAATGRAVMLSNRHWLQEVDINDYPREARWKVTQRETTSRLQDEFRTAVTLKGSHYAPGKSPGPGERRLYLHLEAASERSLQDCVLEIQRILNEETLRVSARSVPGGSISAHKYNVL